MAKRKPAPAAVSGKKAPGARKPRKKKSPAIIPPAPVGATCPFPPNEEREHHEEGGLTLNQERFVYEYIQCSGNATEAYTRVFRHVSRKDAKSLGWRMMQKQHVVDAIESKREDLRKNADITLEAIVTRYVAMWHTGPSQLLEVFRNPGREDSWRGLVGDREFVVKEFSTGEFGNSLKTHSTLEIGNEIRKTLGLKKTNDTGSEQADIESVHDRIREILGGGTKEES